MSVVLGTRFPPLTNTTSTFPIITCDRTWEAPGRHSVSVGCVLVRRDSLRELQGRSWLGEESTPERTCLSVSSGCQVRGGTKEAAPKLPAQCHEQSHPDGPRVCRQPQERDPRPADALLCVSAISRGVLHPALPPFSSKCICVPNTLGPAMTQEPWEVRTRRHGPRRLGVPRGS